MDQERRTLGRASPSTLLPHQNLSARHNLRGQGSNPSRLKNTCVWVGGVLFHIIL